MSSTQRIGFTGAVLLAAAAYGQAVELAPAPRVDFTSLKATPPLRELAPAAVGGWLDTSSKVAVAAAFNTAIVNTENVPMGWTGSVIGCAAGDMSAAYRTAVQTRINWFRAMAGVPDGIVFDSTLSSKNQSAALMMSANQTLSHTPPASWTCYSAAGAEAAGKSNICYLVGFGNVDPGCVAGYMQDSGANNLIVGHRRWLLYPANSRMGTGDVNQTGSFGRANSIWVVDSAALAAPRPATRDTFVAWPPKGYVPYQAVYPRWSFSYPGADFSASTVTMVKNGSAVSLSQLPVATGYGENTIAWETPSTLGVASSADATVTVTVNNVLIGGRAQAFQYNTIIFDPATVSGTGGTIQVTINSSPAGRAVTVDGANFQAPHTFNWTSGSAHSLTVPSPQTIGESERSIFQSWNFSSSNSQTVSPTVNTTYTINFSAEYKLTTSALPIGTGSLSINPPSATGFYSAGQNVTLAAIASPPNVFSNWSGDVSGSASQINFTMNSPVTATAVFSPVTSSAGLHYVPLAPCRIADTRNPSGTFGGPAISGGASRSFFLPNSTCGVPSTAKAYSLNLTVVPSGSLGYVSVWPTGQTQPFVSTLNALDGQITANAAIVPAGVGGGVDVFATNTAHVIIDINGYFEPPRSGASAFFPMTPCRLADTRNGQGGLGGPALIAGAARSFPVRQSACGLPPAATAYVLNVTAVPTGTLGYITAWPTGQNQPVVSTTNSLNGQITANMAIVPAGINGDISFFASDTTHLVVDIAGYFGPPEQPGALKLYPVTPCRLVDTRNPAGPWEVRC